MQLSSTVDLRSASGVLSQVVNWLLRAPGAGVSARCTTTPVTAAACRSSKTPAKRGESGFGGCVFKPAPFSV